MESLEYPAISAKAPLRVCVIDGDAAVRDSLATLMSLNGHEVCAFETGADFIAALDDGSQNCVDCVICEAELPDVSGLELFSAFRRRCPDIRFALLMSRKDPHAISAARRSGVNAVFQKPLVHRTLRAFVTGKTSSGSPRFGNYG